jgi:hypothetical protein
VIPPGKKGIRPADGEDALVGAFSAFGRTSRTPMLWVYAANDSFFRPDLSHRMVDAFTAGGGKVRLIDAPAFGRDGHFLFSSAGLKIWTRFVDDFLRERSLGLREPLPGPPLPELQPPSQLSEQGRAAFADYLAAGPHKAFAVSPKGVFGSWSALRSLEDAQRRALSSCTKIGSGCALYAIENERADANR